MLYTMKVIFNFISFFPYIPGNRETDRQTGLGEGNNNRPPVYNCGVAV